MNKKLYPTNWKAVIEIINNIKPLQLLEQQPTINMSAQEQIIKYNHII